MSRGVELADPDVLTTAEEDALLRGAPWRRFVVLGDSVAEGLGDEVEGYESFPWAARLARALRRHRFARPSWDRRWRSGPTSRRWSAGAMTCWAGASTRGRWGRRSSPLSRPCARPGPTCCCSPCS